AADSAVQLWRPDTAELVRSFKSHYRTVAFSRRNVFAAASHDQRIEMRSMRTGAVMHCLAGQSNGVNCMVFSPDGQLVASGSEDRAVGVYFASSGYLQCMLRGHDDAVRAVAFSGDGKLVASGSSDSSICLWRPPRNTIVCPPLVGHRGTVLSLAFSP